MGIILAIVSAKVGIHGRCEASERRFMLSDGFGPMHGDTLRGVQKELDFHRVEWKNDAAIVGAIEDSGVK